MNHQILKQNIELAATSVGTTWPLYSFVTSNPLSGYEKQNFKTACLNAYQKTGNLALPDAHFFKDALQTNLLNSSQLAEILKTHQYSGNIDRYFEEIKELKSKSNLNKTQAVDQVLVKWMSVFLDEGLADWEMPNKEKGFYAAWKSLAKYDANLNISKSFNFPKDSISAIEKFTNDISTNEQVKIFEKHFASLHGWVGFLKYRQENTTEWFKKFPFPLADYLAVRILISYFLKVSLPSNFYLTESEQKVFNVSIDCLKAIEDAWQNKMVYQLNLAASNPIQKNEPIDVQLVFCIDTRSELIRRNIEIAGNYETYGYAGFFGIAMDYEDAFSGIKRKSCPPILASAYKVTEEGNIEEENNFKKLKKQHKRSSFKNYFLKRMKNILPSAFGFVEGAGLVYGFQLVKRSFFFKKDHQKDIKYLETTCKTKVEHANDASELSLDERVQIVKSAFDLMGWKKFADLVVFAGHASKTANNPFASSLDCGACAASPGRHNARLIAQLANQTEVRKALLTKHQIKLENNTLFIGAEHNTTTDEISLFDGDAPIKFEAKIKALKSDLKIAQKTATLERLGKSNSVNLAYRKSSDWSETRPEWGLAKNAGFIIGPRALTQNMNLESECFLHSYDWKKDEDGTALNAILNGPMVVTQWINNHYYFSTVNNANYGSGSKITLNIVGKFGVVQGNGGDLKTGLPLQSVKQSDENYYHKPQRLSVFINAPKQLINSLLNNNPNLKKLIENEWIHLLAIDPLHNNKVDKYVAENKWNNLSAT
ncbi:putative inorganic carbon transporter subunit DabA [Psychroflexus salis]|uniref:Probable inorganic carbon transporter subunit DabA n=1 Tax=Psychroflexus salis TaxID=1526574 RepID=A0A917E5H4_9FLAO|nr:putative inorganic carbon transporter subunit DabA [Psychroflexus salis]GGE06537.1 UPF0753 protein [Psychroflexus salis]